MNEQIDVFKSVEEVILRFVKESRDPFQVIGVLEYFKQRIIAGLVVRKPNEEDTTLHKKEG